MPLTFIFALSLIGAPPAFAGGEAPVWSANEVKSLLARIPESEKARTQDEKDSYLADVAGFAYHVPRVPQEQTEVYAQRVLKKRQPEHPNVKKGQWVVALFRQFYDDLSKRCDALSRFERDRKDRALYEQKAKEAKAIADYLSGQIEVVVEGVEGFLAPLAVCDINGEPTMYGAQATVKNGAITIENLERVKFKNDEPGEDVIRTAKGAIREVFAAQKQYNVSAGMLGMYEPMWQKNKGNLRVMIPGASPALYLNELVLGALEAEMTTVHLMCMTKKGDLRELVLSLPKAGKKKSAPKKAVETGCKSSLSMQKCVDHLLDAKAKGPLVYTLQ